MFIEEPKLCPVSALREYEGRTKEYRNGHSRNPLFLSVKKPFRAVKPATIGQWLKNLMKEAGIDTSTLRHIPHGELLHQKQRQWKFLWLIFSRQRIRALIQHSAGSIIDLPMTGLDSQY